MVSPSRAGSHPAPAPSRAPLIAVRHLTHTEGMDPQVRLRRLSFVPAPGALTPTPVSFATAHLQVGDGDVVHVVPVDDVVGLLTDLYSTVPHGARGQTLVTRPDGDGVCLTVTSTASREQFRFSAEGWHRVVFALIGHVATEAERAGAQHVMLPLMNVLTAPPAAR